MQTKTIVLKGRLQIDGRDKTPRQGHKLSLLSGGEACIWDSEAKNWLYASTQPDFNDLIKHNTICKVSFIKRFFPDRKQGFHNHYSVLDGDGRYGCAEAGIARSLQIGGIKPSNSRITTDPPDLNNNHIDRGLYKPGLPDLNQIFVRSVEGRHYCIQIRAGMDVLGLKKRIQNIMGTPAIYQNLLFSGRCMQDHLTLQHYGVTNDSTIILNLRLRGGCKGTSSNTMGSFCDAVKGKEPLNPRSAPTSELPGPYIVEQKQDSPLLTVTLPEVTDLYSDLIHNSVICIFNGYWPKADVLHQWVFTAWSPKCEIYICPKGFFIVRFNTELEGDNIIN